MKNITVSVDEETHRLVRIRAAELGTSVSALVREFLRSLADSNPVSRKPNTPDKDNTAVETWPRELDEVLAYFEAKGIGISERMTREELYDEAINGPAQLR